MSYYPIKLDKERNLKFGMRAIDRIEKKYGKPMMEIEGLQDGLLTMEKTATIIWAGLVHEDNTLTPEIVMDLIDEYSSIPEVTKEMWKALNSVFGAEEVEKAEEVVEEKNE
ncbi:hypothetical protein DSECCO2_460530 [anaerobic digester metagenome]